MYAPDCVFVCWHSQIPHQRMTRCHPILLARRNAELEQELVEHRATALERDATFRAMQQRLDESEGEAAGTSEEDPM